MKAVICRDFSPRANLRLEETPSPVPGKGEVLVQVEACGINFFDGLMVEGRYQTRPERPFTPGSEVAGVIAQVGEGVTTLQPGQRVLAFNGIGGYAQGRSPRRIASIRSRMPCRSSRQPAFS